MESNEQTELTSKIETDSYTESRLTALGAGGWGGGIGQKRKRTHGQGQQGADYGDVGGGVEEGTSGINGNGKKATKKE